jgi:hypothetical protein
MKVPTRKTKFPVTLTLAGKTGQTRADAFLPPRPRLVQVIKDWPEEDVKYDKDYGAPHEKCTPDYPGTACALAATLSSGQTSSPIVRRADAGYVFLEKTIRGTPQRIRDDNGNCVPKDSATLVPESLGTQISIVATTGGIPAGEGEYHATICNASAQEIKFDWAWDD